MNARVLLLILVTALFMAAWDGDQSAMQAAIARKSTLQATELVHDAPATMPLGSQAAVMLTSKPNECPSGESLASLTADSVPLPAGIAPGTYQAVCQSGQTLRVEVPARRASGKAVRDFYVADCSERGRWYLIRIE